MDTNGNSLSLPRILCLHGGGINAQIFQIQCRSISARLESTFRLVFVNAPFICAPHPGIRELFGDLGPYRRWIRWLSHHKPAQADVAAREIVATCQKVMEEDPGSGEWVGIMGFSQGAQIAASLLWAQQKVAALPGDEAPLTSFKFGILVAGRAPIARLDMRLPSRRHIAEASDMTFEDWPKNNEGDHVLSIPTVHVHGLKDPGLEFYRLLLNRYCAVETASLVEWDGDHRLPVKEPDVERVVSEVLKVADMVGVQSLLK
ncbi:serine hydrolase FSH [Xylogone sp. PMI_703]|nr:serine hydrolase FSH [Xylogone sp. PMI_703]